MPGYDNYFRYEYDYGWPGSYRRDMTTTEPKWKTKNGRTYVISKMDYNHLQNSIRMMEREYNTHVPIYQSLVAEKKKRDEVKEKSQTDQTRFELMDFE